MPDFTIEYMEQCSQGYGSFNINGHSVIIEEDGHFTCDCKDFTMRKKKEGKPCKHIEEMQKNLCDWHEQFSDECQTENQKKNHICPKCGGKTITVKVAV